MTYLVLIGADRLRGGGYVDQYDDNYNNEPGYDHYGERFPPPGHMEGGYAQPTYSNLTSTNYTKHTILFKL